MLLPCHQWPADGMACCVTTGVVNAGCATLDGAVSLVVIGGMYFTNSVASKNKLLLSLGVNN